MKFTDFLQVSDLTKFIFFYRVIKNSKGVIMPKVSGYISDESKQKKEFIFVQKLPSNILVPSSITVSKEVFKNTIMADREPTPALIKLMNGNR